VAIDRRVRRLFVGVRRLDVVIAGVVAVVGQLEVWLPVAGFSNPVGPRWAVAAAYIVPALALLWRRLYPLSVLGVVAVVQGLEFAVFGSPEGLGSFLPGVVAIYAVGRYSSTRRFLAGLALLTGWIAIHELRDPLFVFSGTTATVWMIAATSGFLGLAFRAQAREIADERQRTKNAELERDRRERDAAAAERARISHDMHDVVGHSVTLMILQLAAAQGSLERGLVLDAQTRLSNAEETARMTLAELRRLVHLLADEEPALAPQPGISDVEGLVAEVSAAGVPVTYRLERDSTAMPPGLGLAAYRLVQEGLTNVIKHAREPRDSAVIVGGSAAVLTVEITDRGAGPYAEAAEGYGLSGMRTRVEMYGGTLNYGPHPDGGFRVVARFPLTDLVA
jgi:signal transduction histidine kinase